MDKEHIIEKLKGVKDHHPATHYIRCLKRIRKSDQYVLSIPLWQNGRRKSQHIGTFNSLKEAQEARDFAFQKIEELKDVSFSPPSHALGELRKPEGK